MVKILVLWNVIGSLIWFTMRTFTLDSDFTGAVGTSKGCEFVNPFFVYKHNKVNWFGALVLALFYSMLCPIGTLCYWFYKICTIGRKD